VRDAVAVAALVSAAAWLAHASIDWLWELPALSVPAMACLGLVLGLSRDAGAQPGPAIRVGGLGRGLAIAVVVAAALSFALPALAALQIERAARSWDRDPSGALRELDQARRLNPLTDRADVIAGALALATRDRVQARRSFQRAVGRDGHNWYAWAELGILDLRAGRRQDAFASLIRAQQMNPSEPAIASALAAARQGTSVPPDVELRLSNFAVPGPLGRHPVTCRPVLGLATGCEGAVGS
jgi:tetratricopeptide (TPR) repeat protein